MKKKNPKDIQIEVCITECSCAIQNVTRSVFLKSQFPLLPYCEFHRGPSTKYNESFHIENKNTGLQLNFWWRSDNQVSINTYNSLEKNPFNRNKDVRIDNAEFNNELIARVCKFLLL